MLFEKKREFLTIRCNWKAGLPFFVSFAIAYFVLAFSWEPDQGFAGSTGGAQEANRPGLAADLSPQTQVLILAAPRTGSSFLSALLASYPNTTLIYEPLFALRTTPEAISERDVGLSLMDELFQCNVEALNFVAEHSLITKTKPINQTCYNSKMLVIKTIRLRLKFGLPWLRLRSNIKVIHLVRDPRGQLASLSKTNWPHQRPTEQCSQVLSDVQLSAHIPEDRLMRIKYEDLVGAHRQGILEDLAAFLSLPREIPPEVTSFLNFTNQSTTDQGVKNSSATRTIPQVLQGWKMEVNAFASVIRSADFDPNAGWKLKGKLEPHWLQEVERECADLMARLNYTRSTSVAR